MKKYSKIIIIFTSIVFTITAVYATNVIASLRKSPILPWQWTYNWYYDTYHNTWDSYLPDSRFSCVSWVCSWTSTNWVVFDNITKLYWEYHDYGNCTWSNCITRCNNSVLWWYSDWRMPNVKELQSVQDLSTYNPTILASIFYPSTAYTWTSTPYPSNSTYVYMIDFWKWRTTIQWKAWYANIRCIRSN